MTTKQSWDFEVEIMEVAPEKAYLRDSWPKEEYPRIVYCKSDDVMYFIPDQYSVSQVYNPKVFGIREARPRLHDSAEYLLEALAVAVHNKRLGT